MQLFRLDMIDDAVVVDAPPEAVFAQLLGIDRWSTWTGAIKRSRKRSRGDWRTGATIEFVPTFAPLPIVAKVLELEPDRVLAWGLKLPGTGVVHRFDLAPVDGGERTRVRQREWAWGGIALAMRPLRHAIHEFDKTLGEDLRGHFRRAEAAA